VVLDLTPQRHPRVQVGLLPGHGRGTRADVGGSGFIESAAQNRQPPGPSGSLQPRLVSLATNWFCGMGEIPHLSPPFAAAVARDPPSTQTVRKPGADRARAPAETAPHQTRWSELLPSPVDGAEIQADQGRPPAGTARHPATKPSPLAPPRWPRLRSPAYEQIERKG
jgi:hypothetical protein